MIEKNSLSHKSIFSDTWVAPVLSFFATSAFLCLFFFLLGIAPFGARTSLVSDLLVQYAPFLIGYKEQLLSGQMFSYSFMFGSGKNTVGMFAYYLSSPFNFLTFLFPKTMMSQAVVLIMTLKLSLSSAFMTLFLQYRSGKKDKLSAVFGMMYSFSSYAVVYMISIMWLDGFMLLPLLLLFVERYLENNRKWISIVIILCVLFISGYYIAYMVGIFSFIYLILRLIEKGLWERAASAILRFIGCAVLAAGICAALLLPAGLDTIRNADYLEAGIQFSARFVLVRILDQLFFGSFDSLSSNLPLIYSGLITSILAGLYFFNPAFTRRSKTIAGALMAGFLVSFHFSILDLAWHLFDLPNWFQFRYSFLLVFVMVLYAYLSMTRLDQISRKVVLRGFFFFLGVLIFVHSFGNLASESERFYFNLAFGLLYFLILFGMTFSQWPEPVTRLRRFAIPILIVLILFDVATINPILVRSQALGSLSTPIRQIEKDINNADTLVEIARQRARERGIVFDRIDVDRKINSIEASAAGPILQINGMSTFQTGSNKPLHRFYKQLGFATNYNYFTSSHSYSSVVPDSILGLSHILSEREKIGGMNRVASAGANERFIVPSFVGIAEVEETTPESAMLNLFENESALPAFFVMKNSAIDFDFYQLEKTLEKKNYFEFQNQWLGSMFDAFDAQEPIYYPAEGVLTECINAISTKDKRIGVEPNKFSFTDTLSVESPEAKWDGLRYYLQVNPQASMILNYEIVIESEDPLYMCVPFPVRGFDGRIFVNGEDSFFTSHSFFSMISQVGSFDIGETVEVSIVYSSKVQFAMMTESEVDFYYCDTAKFKELIAEENPGSGVSSMHIENGYASADVAVAKESYLFTSIPYEPGWTLRVDQKKVEIVPYQDAWIGILLDAGTHHIELTFEAPGLRAGAIVSGVSIGAFIALLAYSYISKRKRK